ncbi:MAG TPA: hypothetical protein VMI06_09155 [Terriglobia bacterium]|nr:hypothetical protein [Terriglobia bacterium]
MLIAAGILIVLLVVMDVFILISGAILDKRSALHPPNDIPVRSADDAANVTSALRR